MTKPLCIAPWITRYVSPKGNVSPCCEYRGYLPNLKGSDSYDEYFNNDYLNIIKQKLINQEYPEECENCRLQDLTEVQSMRKNLSNYSYDLEKFNLKYFDERFSNLCNFSCKMCGETLSSTWGNLQNSIGESTSSPLKKSNINLNEIYKRVDQIESMTFAGGEPLLVDETFNILKHCVDKNSTDKEITIITNGSLLHRSQLDILNQFKYVRIAVSLDCLGNQHNYWRQKNTIVQVQKNIQKIVDNDISLHIRCTIGWPNIFAARDVFDFYSDVKIRVGIVNNPKYLKINMVPNEYHKKILDHWINHETPLSIIKDNINLPKIENYKQTLKRWKLWNEKVDDYNNTFFIEAFPEWKEFYDNI